MMFVKCQDYQGHSNAYCWEVTHTPFAGQCPPPCYCAPWEQEVAGVCVQKVEDKPSSMRKLIALFFIMLKYTYYKFTVLTILSVQITGIKYIHIFV